jgi:hypothetical protein
MRLFTCLFVSASFLFAVVNAQGQEISSGAASRNAARGAMPCVEVQIGQDRVSQMNCLNEAFRRSVEHEHKAPVPEAPITAQSASNKVGTFNNAAAQQMMGNAYGVSAVPQRPHNIFTSPLIGAPR